MSDDRLVGAARAGSEAAETEIVRRYRPALIAYSVPIVGVDEADDVVNQATLRAVLALRRGDAPRVLRPWLFTITQRCAIDSVRRSRRESDLHDPPPFAPAASQHVESRETMREIVRELGYLPVDDRRALVARELEGSSYEEIADELGRSVGAVRQMIYRARSRVRDGAAALLPIVGRPGPTSGGRLLAQLGLAGDQVAAIATASIAVSATLFTVGPVGRAPSSESPRVAPVSRAIEPADETWRSSVNSATIRMGAVSSSTNPGATTGPVRVAPRTATVAGGAAPAPATGTGKPAGSHKPARTPTDEASTAQAGHGKHEQGKARGPAGHGPNQPSPGGGTAGPKGPSATGPVQLQDVLKKLPGRLGK